MTLHVFTTQEKLVEVERQILLARHDPGVEQRQVEILKSVAADLRARLSGAPSVALFEMEKRVVALKRSRTTLGYHTGAMIALAQEVAARWPLIKQALELFGAEIETTQAAVWPSDARGNS